MPSKHNLNVSVTEHLARFVADQVGSGRFSTASEAVRAGLRLLENELAAASQSGASASGDAVPSGHAPPGAAVTPSKKAHRSG